MNPKHDPTYDPANCPEPCKCRGVIEAQILDKTTKEVLEREQFDYYKDRCLETVTFNNASPYPDEEQVPNYGTSCNCGATEFELDEHGRESKPIATVCKVSSWDAVKRDGISLSSGRVPGSKYPTAMGVMLENSNGERFREFWTRRDNYPDRTIAVNYRPGLCKAGSWLRALGPEYRLNDNVCYNLRVVKK